MTDFPVPVGPTKRTGICLDVKSFRKNRWQADSLVGMIRSLTYEKKKCEFNTSQLVLGEGKCWGRGGENGRCRREGNKAMDGANLCGGWVDNFLQCILPRDPRAVVPFIVNPVEDGPLFREKLRFAQFKVFGFRMFFVSTVQNITEEGIKRFTGIT